MKKAKAGLVALAAMASFGVAYAANWSPLNLATSNADYAIDATSLEIGPDGSVRAWFKAQYHRPQQTANGQPMSSVTFNNRYYCKSRQVSAGPTYGYDGSGNVVFRDGTYSPATDIVPDTVDEALFITLCRNQ